jgi:hypothetical protein
MEREQLISRFNSYISSKAMNGFVVVDKNEAALSCVLRKEGEKINHVLHLLLTIFTCFWGIVWIVKAMGANKEVRIRASIDSSGNLLEEKVSGKS